MSNRQEPTDSFKQLYGDVKKYLGLQAEYVKTEMVEKMTILFSTLLLAGLIVVLVVIVLFYLCFSLAYALESYFGSLAVSFAVISGIYVLLIALLVVFRNKLIVNPLVRFLSDLFLNK